MGSICLEYTDGASGHRMYSRKREEFMADFCLVTRRTLNDYEHKIFRYTFLLGADCRLTIQRLGLDRVAFFRDLYRMQQKLGRVYAEVRPYSLYPLDEYLGGKIRKDAVRARVAALPPKRRRRRVRMDLPLTA